jgi:hypothetical protein
MATLNHTPTRDPMNARRPTTTIAISLCALVGILALGASASAKLFHNFEAI